VTPDELKTEPTAEALPAAEQDRLARILDDYLAAVERGTPISPDELLQRHRQDAPYLRGYLSGLELFHAAAIGRDPAGSAPSDAPAAEPPGRTIGDYRLLREIGRGGMGVVYEAMQLSLRRRVALKVLPLAAAHSPQQINRFKNEAQAAAQLHHPNIVPVFAVGEEHGVHYYAMQLVEGQSLSSMIEELRGGAACCGRSPDGCGRSPDRATCAGSGDPRTTGGTPRTTGAMDASRTADHVRAVARLGIQAAEALHAAHEYGIVHRDVKPSNLLVDDDGKLWVTDFGLARCRETSGLTQSGDVLGTMRYMSPEQVLGRVALIDHRTDIYSLGVTLYELATLCHPAEGVAGAQSPFERAHPVCKPLRQRNRYIPQDFQTIIMKSLAEFPHERYATAQEMADDLQRLLSGEPILASPPSLVNRAGKWARRHQGAVATAAGMLVVAMVGLVASLIVVAGWKAAAEQAFAQSEANHRQAVANLVRAQQNLRQARTVLDRLGTRLAEQLAAIPGAEGVRRQLLEDSIGFYRQLADQSADDPSLFADLALAYSKIGGLTEKIGDRQRALEAHTSARKLLEELVAREPANTEYKRNLALCDNNIGLLLAGLGRTGEALDSLHKAQKLQDELRAADPTSDELAGDVATTCGNLGLVLSETGATDQAAEKYRQAIAIQERLVKAAPDGEVALRSLAASYNNLGSLDQSTDGPAAIDAYRKAIAIQRTLVQSHPTNRIYQSDLARTYNNLGYASSRRQDWSQAELCYKDAIRIQENLVKAAPLAAAYRRDLAVSDNNLGMVQSQVGSLDQAEATFREALRLQQLLLAAQPKDVQTLSNLGGVYNNLGMLLDRQQRPRDAEEAYCQAISYQRQALRISPDAALPRSLLSKHYYNYGKNLRSQSRPAEAVDVALQRRQLWPGRPDRLYSVAQELAAAYEQMSGMANPDPQAQEKCLDAAVATLREALGAGLPAQRLGDASLAALADRNAYRQLVAETHPN
jgi:serine/threonine protein kinase/tetratricopeptide (TPR) repeat protein